MEEQLNIQDESGDKDYFTIIPNYIANHSNANDQALYFQMKRITGDKGKCYATSETLMRKLGIGRKAYNKSLNYLLEKRWISYIGITNGKTRPIKTYKINNIWRMNNEHYKKINPKSTVSIGDTSQKNTKISPERTVEEEQEKKTRTIVEQVPPTTKKINELHLKVVELFDFFKSEFKSKISDKPLIFAWGKCEKLAKPHIRQLGLERLKELTDAYFASDDQFYKKSGYSLEVFLTANVLNAIDKNV